MKQIFVVILLIFSAIHDDMLLADNWLGRM